MMLLRIALAIWLTAVCFAYQAYWIVLIVAVLFIQFSKKHVCCYLACTGILFVHSWNNPAIPEIFQGKVVSVKEHAVVVELKDQSVLVNNVSDVYFHDYIVFEGSYQPITGYRNFHLFDYEFYLKQQNIAYQLYASKVQVLKRGNSLLANLHRWVMKQKNPAFVALAKQMLLQIKEDSHPLLSTLQGSGMHISSLVRMSERLLSFFYTEQLLAWSAWFLPSLLLLCFGPQIAILRILLNQGIRHLPVTKSSKTGLLMILLLLYRPMWATSLAFVFPMSLRIASLYRPAIISSYWYRQLLSVPILLAAQFQVTVLQLLLFPILRHWFAGLYLGCFAGLLIPALQSLVVNGYQISEILVTSHSWLTWGIIGRMSVLFAVLWIFLACCFQRSMRTAGLALLLLIGIHGASGFLQPFAQVICLDVGQGDATLILLPFRQGSILIDTGGHPSRDLADVVLVPYLHSMGISKLDLVILTHEDMDHSGAYESLSKKIQIVKTITEKPNANQQSIEQHQVGPAVFQLLLQDRQYESTNDNGLIILLELYGKRLLFMGDVGTRVEHDLRKIYDLLQVDILHVGHHGSNTSTSKEFLTHTKPSLAIISSGRNNRYGHPHADVIQRLTDQNIAIADTQKVGSIAIYFGKFVQFYRTYEEHFGIIDAVIR